MSAVPADDIERAATTLRAGGLVAFPTETVYGLGASAGDADAVARLYAVKQRPADHPVIVHLAAAGELAAWAVDVPAAALALADRFWPGPLTLVLRRAPGVLDAVTGGQETIGLRVPDQPLALALLRAFGGGIAAPSANRFGAVSPTTAAHVHASLGDDVDLILDGGPCAVGVESTIVDLSGPGEPRLLRAGGVTVEQLTAALGATPRVDRGRARAPGMLATHYAPQARVELCANAALLRARAAALLAAGERSVGAILPPTIRDDELPRVTILARPPDAQVYARDLYALLREADERGITTLLVVPPAAGGVGLAVRDRLTRAARAANR